jgi:hypothetical protein
MSRPQDKSNGLPTEGQAAQQGTQAAGPGTTAGAAATGTAGTGTTATPGTTTTGVRDRSGATHEQSSTTTGYQRGSAPAASHRGGGGTGAMTGGVLAVVAGLLTFLAGLAAVVRQHFYPVLSGYAYTWNVRNWGWVLLVLGVLLFAAGACALLGMAWARAVGIGLAILTAIAGFLFLAFTPVWGVVIVAVSVFAIWGMAHDGAEHRTSV